MKSRKAQSLAAVNPTLRHHVEGVLAEVMTGVQRDRSDLDGEWVVTFVLQNGKLVADVRTPDGGHAGTWAITPRAI